MKKSVLRLMSLLLCGMLGCAPLGDTIPLHLYAYLGRNMPKSPVAHTDLTFSELPFDPVDPAELRDKIDALSTRIRDADDASAPALQAELEALWREAEALESMASLAYVHHCLDVTDALWAARSNRLNASLDGVFAAWNDAALRLSAFPSLRKYYPPETARLLEASARLYAPAVQPLLHRETELMDAYDALEQTLSVTVDGEAWTEARIEADTSLPFAAWYAIRTAYDAAYAEAAAELFRELIAVRRQIAALLGFDSYPAYRYAVYGRDYAPSDSARFCDSVQSLLVPLFRRALLDTASDREVLLLTDGNRMEETTLAAVADVIAEIDPRLSEPWAYLISHALYDCSASETKLSGSFTTYFASCGAPFLYVSWDGSYEMPTTLLHEFGHYAAYYRRGSAGVSLDLAEAQSQALELLAFPYYAAFYGNRADEARAVKLCDLLYAIASGCLIDAFEQAAYAMDDPTAEALAETFDRLCRAYGLDDAGFTATAWTRIPHLFRAPSYYISYALGAVTALELYRISLEHPNKAAALYWRLLGADGTDRASALRRCGLMDSLTDKAVQTVAELWKNSMDRTDAA